MLSDLSIREFMAETASKSPTPGGGSVAALSGAIAASLSEMVANLTIGRKGFDAVAEEMQAIAANASEIRDRLTADIDRDSEAFDQVMVAFRLPKDTSDEKETRTQAIQYAMKHATMVPLEVAERAFELMGLAGKVVTLGNKNALTDGAVGVMMARTAVRGALFNVRTNLTSIRDENFVREISQKADALTSLADAREKEILAHVKL
ncbi:MAG: methenyltetrahydrofolate cyclohydrolase [Desulfobacteraceae bacterium 4572_88]|nr:MAG: methenyltetrahydrofolate cyclohydrolase [Desulfobacteraceae bacterium 4572_88]